MQHVGKEQREAPPNAVRAHNLLIQFVLAKSEMQQERREMLRGDVD
jgi:hypothetical protein